MAVIGDAVANEVKAFGPLVDEEVNFLDDVPGFGPADESIEEGGTDAQVPMGFEDAEAEEAGVLGSLIFTAGEGDAADNGFIDKGNEVELVVHLRSSFEKLAFLFFVERKLAGLESDVFASLVLSPAAVLRCGAGCS